MAFQLSPGVLVTEKDLTNIVPAVATSAGGYAGVFAWGPSLDPTSISSENQLVARFGKPVTGNAASFFTAANFLSYTNNLVVVRADTAGSLNAVAVQSGSVTGVTITEPGEGYDETEITVEVSEPDQVGGTQAELAAVIVDGSIVDFTIVEAGSGYSEAPTITVTDTQTVPTGSGFVGVATITVSAVKIRNKSEYEDLYINGAGVYGPVAAKYSGSLGNSIRVEMADSASFGDWDYAAEFDGAPNTTFYADSAGAEGDELHIIILDELGLWTGTPGAILEKFAYVSKASDARKDDGTNNYYRNVLNDLSKYVWWMDHPVAVESGDPELAWGTPAGPGEYASSATPISLTLTGGSDDYAAVDGDLIEAFSLFRNAEQIDVGLIPCGPVSKAVAKYVVESVAEYRKDAVAFVSPTGDGNGPIVGLDIIEDTITWRQDPAFNVSSSYGTLDSGFKYQYDRYNDVYRWVPLNGDIAGLCARTEYTNDAWWSPGGLNRGQIKNVLKLSVNPDKTDRDNLYKNGINPVVSFPGQGTVLFGDKTLLAKPSAFDRINVRRLFIVLEKAIATAAKFQLFEFNDTFTRAQFRSIVEPFLRDVQGRRGVTDFLVVCDETNNTGEVIDRNEFIADIYIKPARSINFIGLNFIATRTGISFEEVLGA